MARRSLSMQGRVIAAGVSIAVGGALVGFMAAGDHSADATPGTGSVNPATGIGATDPGGSSGTSAVPSDGRSSDGGFGSDGTTGDTGDTGFQPQAQTRTGGS